MKPASDALRDGRLTGAAWRMAAAVLVFLVWRVAGMPLPGTAGRFLPAAWALSALMAPCGPPRRTEAASLVLFTLSALLWRMSEAVLLASMTLALAGVFPAMLRRASGSRWWEPFAAVLPLVPVILGMVPFTGDEAFNAALSESIIVDRDSDISNNLRQLDDWSPVSPETGAPAEGFSHHQPLFALLMAPGLLFGIAGFRLAPLAACCGTAALTAAVLRRTGGPASSEPASWTILLLPGAACLGLAYPDWTAALIISASVLATSNRRRALTVSILACILLAALKTRFAPAGLGLVAAALRTGGRRSGWRILIITALAVVLGLLADRLLLGGRFFWIRYGNIEFLKSLFLGSGSRLGQIASIPLWWLVDQEAGILWRAPWLVPALFGLPALWRRRPDLARPLVFSGLAYLAGIALWLPGEWHSMPTPTGRLLIPLLPLAAAGATQIRPGRLLLGMSAFVSSLYMAVPWLRFNHLDGRDALLDRLSLELPHQAALAFPSMVRPDVLIAVAWLAALLTVVLLSTRGRDRGAAAVLAVSLAASALVPAGLQGVWEAEDLPADNRIGCMRWPESFDPTARLGWTEGKELLLRVGGPGDAVLLPVPRGDGATVTVELVARGLALEGVVPTLRVSCGNADTLLRLDSPRAPLPSWITSVRGRDAEPPPDPGLLSDTLLVVRLPASGGCCVMLTPGEPCTPPAGFYIDRARLSR